MATTTLFNMTRDINGYNGFGVQPSNVKYGVQLAQNVEQNFTLPGDSSTYLAIFTYNPGANVFIDFTTTAAAFSGTIGQTTAELNPVARQIPQYTTVSMITPDTGGALVGVELYVVSPYGN